MHLQGGSDEGNKICVLTIELNPEDSIGEGLQYRAIYRLKSFLGILSRGRPMGRQFACETGQRLPP